MALCEAQGVYSFPEARHLSAYVGKEQSRVMNFGKIYAKDEKVSLYGELLPRNAFWIENIEDSTDPVLSWAVYLHLILFPSGAYEIHTVQVLGSSRGEAFFPDGKFTPKTKRKRKSVERWQVEVAAQKLNSIAKKALLDLVVKNSKDYKHWNKDFTMYEQAEKVLGWKPDMTKQSDREKWLLEAIDRGLLKPITWAQLEKAKKRNAKLLDFTVSVRKKLEGVPRKLTDEFLEEVETRRQLAIEKYRKAGKRSRHNEDLADYYYKKPSTIEAWHTEAKRRKISARKKPKTKPKRKGI